MHFPARFAPKLVVLALTSGCVPDFGVDLSAIREPRLLAIAATPAEAKGGEETTLSALVAVPPGSQAGALNFSLCLERKPLTELGPVSPDCLDLSSGARRLDLGSAENPRAMLDKDVCRLFGPVRPAATADEPAGRPVDPDITGGFYQPVVASLDRVTSLGAIRIDCDPANLNRDDALSFRRQYRVNENPRVSSLSFGLGKAPPDHTLDLEEPAIEVKAQSHVTLRAAWDSCSTESSCSGAEHYVWYDRESERIEPRREAISVAWFTSSGSFESEQTGLSEAEVEAGGPGHTDNRWRVGEAAGDALVWLVIRDSRGGQSWRTLRFKVTP